MNYKQLLDLEKEMRVTDLLLNELSKIAAAQKLEDGSTKKKTKKKRKKQKLTPEQKRKQKQEQKLIKKVKEKLSDRKYKSKQTGDELSFNTAYNRRHPKAVKDFNNAMDKAKGSDSKSKSVEYSVAATLNDEQYDLLQRMNNGRDMRDMSLVEERTMREIFALLADIHQKVQDEGIEEPPPPKKRKTRSDKGVKRGPYQKKVEEELTTSLEDEGIEVEDLNVQETSSITSSEVKKTKGVLDERAKEREATGEKEPKKKAPKKTPKKTPKKKEKFVENAPLAEQPTFVQKAEIKERLENIFKDSLSKGTSLKIDKLQSKLDEGVSEEEERDIKEKIKELKKKDLASTRKETKTMTQRISDAVDKLEDLTEEQVREMVDAYGEQGKIVEEAMREQGLKGLQDFLEDENKGLKPPNKKSKTYAQDLGKFLALTHAKKSIAEDPEFGLKDFPTDGDVHDKEKHLEAVRRAQSRRFKEMNQNQRNDMVNRVSDQIENLEAQLDSDLSDEERQKVEGKLLNLKASQTALNTIRMIKSEGVIDGYFEVPDHMLELARQTGSEAWEEGISMLSQQGTNPSKTKELIESVTDNLDIEDFKATVGGEQGPYGSMMDFFDDDYCPGGATNEARGVGGKKLKPGDDSCPNPLSDNVKKMLRDYMTGGFVNLHTVEKESKGDGYYKPKKNQSASSKVKKQMESFWRENKDKFFEVFVDGVDKSTGKPYTEDEREAAGEEFRTRWMVENMESSIQGVQIYGDNSKKFRWQQIMEEIKKVKSSTNEVNKRQRLKEIRERLTNLFDETATKPANTPNKKANIFNKSFIDDYYMSGGTKIMQKQSTQYVDYQRRSQAFELGMRVYPFLGGNPSRSGIVVAIFPAIGMVDVQFPHGAQRYPVEDLVVDTSGDYKNLTKEESSVPGGLGTAPVSSGKVNKQAKRVASNYVKQAIYWYKKDRTYRQCRNEEKPCCPKCKEPLGNTVYKRRGGKSERLLACHTCLFIIKPEDIIKG
jgi:hypothetical protein